MRLRHLGLPVRDLDRSREFYVTYFGFDADTAQRYPDGTVIVRDGSGFDLALHQSADFELPDFLHFGFSFEEPAAVRTLLERLRADGVELIEEDDDEQNPEFPMVSFKCADPDGHRVEAYWEP